MSESVFHKKVKDIVTRDTVTLNAVDTVHEALELMGENLVSALPVVDTKNRCVGILAAADLIDLTRDTDEDIRELDLVDLSTKRFLIDKLAHSLGNESIQTFMSESVVTVGLETSIQRGHATRGQRAERDQARAVRRTHSRSTTHHATVEHGRCYANERGSPRFDQRQARACPGTRRWHDKP